MFFQAEDGIRDLTVTGVQTCALPIFLHEALAQTELRGERAHQLHLESDQLRWIARVSKDVRLPALEVSGPADLALRADPGKPRCRDEERQRQGGHRHR